MVKIDPEVKERYPGFVTGYAIVHDIKVQKRVDELEKEKRKLIEAWKSKYEGVAITAIPEVILYRSFFKLMGVDPSRFRPPSEYLLRRAVTERLPLINNAVDCCLLTSVEYWVVTGIYDLDKIVGEPVITLQKTYEEFELIDGRILAPKIGEIVLRDDEKILCAFALGDAKATLVGPETKNVLLISWNAPGIEEAKVELALKATCDYIRKFCEGRVKEVKILE